MVFRLTQRAAEARAGARVSARRRPCNTSYKQFLITSLDHYKG